MDPKPLGYDSLKIILKYMDANKRFEISQCIPSIQTADRVTPLCIDELRFNGYDLFINNVKYTLRICAENQIAQNNTHHRTIGKLTNDLDQFGLEDFSTEAMITPGDLIRKWNSEVPTNNEIREDRERRLRYLQGQLDTARNEQNRSRKNTKRFKQEVERIEAELVPYHCYRENKPLPYEINPYIEFRQATSIGVVKEERVSYNRKLPEAMKYLTTKLFGNRRHPIKVRRLVNSQNYKTIRLPVNLKMKVRELEARQIHQAMQILPVIQSSMVEAFRLDSPREVDFEKELLKTAQTLTIRCLFIEDWLPVVQNLRNRQVLLRDTEIHFDNYTLLMKHWIENGRAVGTCFSVQLGLEYTANTMRSMVMKEFGGLTLTMNNQCKIVVSIEEMLPEMQEEFCMTTWMMKMEVVE